MSCLQPIIKLASNSIDILSIALLYGYEYKETTLQEAMHMYIFGKKINYQARVAAHYSIPIEQAIGRVAQAICIMLFSPM